MAKIGTQHVVPHPEGGWAVKKGGAVRATRHFDTQAAAISWGRAVSTRQGSDLYIHRRDGTVLRKDSHTHGSLVPGDIR